MVPFFLETAPLMSMDSIQYCIYLLPHQTKPKDKSGRVSGKKSWTTCLIVNDQDARFYFAGYIAKLNHRWSFTSNIMHNGT